MGTITRRPAGQEDLLLFDGVDRTTTVTNEAGQVVLLHSIGNIVDVCATYGSKTLRTGAVIQGAIAAVGNDKVTLELAPGDWTISSNLTVPSNCILLIRPGAVLHVQNSVLTINGDVLAAKTHWLQIGTGGSVVFGKIDFVYPEWFSTNAVPGTTDMTNAIQQAILSIKSYGGTVRLSSTVYAITSVGLYKNVTLAGNGSKSIIKALTSSGNTFYVAEHLWENHNQDGYWQLLSNFFIDASTNSNDITLLYSAYNFNKLWIDGVSFIGNPNAYQCGIHIYHSNQTNYNKIYHNRIQGCTFLDLNSPNGMIFLEGDAVSGWNYNNNQIISNLFHGKYQACIKSTGMTGSYIQFNCFNPPSSGTPVSIIADNENAGEYYLDGGNIFRLDLQDSRFCYIGQNWFEQGDLYANIRLLNGSSGNANTDVYIGPTIVDNIGISYPTSIADMSWTNSGSTEGIVYTKVNSSTIRLTGDLTGKFYRGSMIYLKQYNGGWYSAKINSVTYSNPNTTITINRSVLTSDGLAYTVLASVDGPTHRHAFLQSRYSMIQNLVVHSVVTDKSVVVRPFSIESPAGLTVDRRQFGDVDNGRAGLVQAGGAKADSTNANGGNLQLKSGIATGNGGSRIQFYAVKLNQGTGTSDREPMIVGEWYGDGAIRLYQYLTSHPAVTSDSVKLYAANIANAGVELWVKDGAGNTTQLSPHAIGDLPSLPDGIKYPWVYKSRNDYLGVETVIDVAGAIREIEKMSGKKFIYERDIEKESWPDDQEKPQLLLTLEEHIRNLNKKD